MFWCLLTREEDYAYQQPSLTRKKLRRLEIAAGTPKYPGRTNIWSTNLAIREAERKLAEQAELAYRNTVRDWQAAQANRTAVEVGASVTPGHASNRPSKIQCELATVLGVLVDLPRPEDALAQAQAVQAQPAFRPVGAASLE